MKKEYKRPEIHIDEQWPEMLCAACSASLTNQSDLEHCGYGMDLPGFTGTVFLFPQGAGGCTCWTQGITDMYCYMPSESMLFSS